MPQGPPHTHGLSLDLRALLASPHQDQRWGRVSEGGRQPCAWGSCVTPRRPPRPRLPRRRRPVSTAGGRPTPSPRVPGTGLVPAQRADSGGRGQQGDTFLAARPPWDTGPRPRPRCVLPLSRGRPWKTGTGARAAVGLCRRRTFGVTRPEDALCTRPTRKGNSHVQTRRLLACPRPCASRLPRGTRPTKGSPLWAEKAGGEPRCRPLRPQTDGGTWVGGSETGPSPSGTSGSSQGKGPDQGWQPRPQASRPSAASANKVLLERPMSIKFNRNHVCQ